MVYNLSYNIIGLIFLAILTAYFFIIPIFPNRSNKWFRIILAFSTISLSLDILTGHTINNSTSVPVGLNYFLNIIFFISYWTLSILFFQYAYVITKKETNYPKTRTTLITIYMILMISSILLTPLLHTIFYFDENMIYRHGFLYVPFSIANLSIILFAGVFVIAKRKNITRIQLIVIPSYTVIILSANLIQVFYPQFFVNGTSLAISSFIMFLTLQNPNSYFDNLTRIYSRESFQEYLYRLVVKNIHFQVTIVDINKTNLINKNFGEEIGNKVISEVARRIQSVSNTKDIFRIEGDTFLIVTTDEISQKFIIERLKQVFPFSYNTNNYKFTVKTHIHYSKTLYDFESTNEAIAIIKECYNQTKNSSTKYFSQTSVERVRRVRKIEKSLIDAIEENTLSIFLQPIISSKTGKVVNAEALVRLEDKDLGLIMPSEFIYLAERNGSISKIAPLILDKICKYINSTDLPKEFDKISINLSVLNCIDPFFAPNVLDILRENNTSPEKFIFEVTETMASVAPQLEETMTILQKEGIAFAMDDFGTGYANLDSVLQLPFNIVKIDRQLLLLINDIRYRAMMEGLIKILNTLNLQSVIEGVETENQATIVKQMGATYQQGYYYAKPLSLKDFTKYIKSH